MILRGIHERSCPGVRDRRRCACRCRRYGRSTSCSAGAGSPAERQRRCRARGGVRTGRVPELFALSAQRTVTGLASTPVGFATAAIALAQGQNNVAAAILKEIVDGPQWAADPAIYALDDLLPAPIGGDDANEPTEPDADSAISQFRADVLIAARDDVNEAIADSLGLGTRPDVDNEGPGLRRGTARRRLRRIRACAPPKALSPRRWASWPSRKACRRVSNGTATRICTGH